MAAHRPRRRPEGCGADPRASADQASTERRRIASARRVVGSRREKRGGALPRRSSTSRSLGCRVSGSGSPIVRRPGGGYRTDAGEQSLAKHRGGCSPALSCRRKRVLKLAGVSRAHCERVAVMSATVDHRGAADLVRPGDRRDEALARARNERTRLAPRAAPGGRFSTLRTRSPEVGSSKVPRARCFAKMQNPARSQDRMRCQFAASCSHLRADFRNLMQPPVLQGHAATSERGLSDFRRVMQPGSVGFSQGHAATRRGTSRATGK